MVESIIFWAFALLAVGSALGAVLHRNVVYAALFLIVVFLSIAGFFVLNNADFLAIAQVIIYAVGLTIIMLFAIMFTGTTLFPRSRASKATWLMYGLVVAYVLGLLLRISGEPFSAQTSMLGLQQGVRLQTEGSTTLLGQALFSTYSLPFELASLLLLGAMIGAIVIAKKNFVDWEESLGATRYPLETASDLPEEAKKARERVYGEGSSPARATHPEDETPKAGASNHV